MNRRIRRNQGRGGELHADAVGNIRELLRELRRDFRGRRAVRGEQRQILAVGGKFEIGVQRRAGVARSLPEARRSIIKDLGGMLVAGKRHLPGLPALSVNAQLSRLTLLPDVFWISIQSEESPSSSTSVLVLLAMNSVMRTWAVAGTASDAIK